MKNLIVKHIQDQLLTGAEIARELGVTRQYVSLIAKMIGIAPYRKPEKTPKPPKEKIINNDPLKDQRKKYVEHRCSAKKRGIEFNLTFDEWWGLWEPHYHLRGVGKGKMCMCRTLDKGAYELGNVRIDYVSSNGHERKLSHIDKKGPNWKMSGISKKGCGKGLPYFCMSQVEDIEEDPFVYYDDF